MTWDFRLNPTTRDLEPGLVSGSDEIAQRLLTRLQRELGEWFLNTGVGLPWYGGGQTTPPPQPTDPANRPDRPGPGQGILGAKPDARRAVELLLRREILETEGVERISKMNALFPTGSRAYAVYLEVLLRGSETLSLNLQGEY